MPSLVAWAVAHIRATPVRKGDFYVPAVEGPTAIPFRNMHGTGEGHPNQSGLYGRYLPIDLDDNNRHIIAAWRESHPDQPAPSLGWGVCRHGFGLQEFGDGHMDQPVAEARAIALNAARPATEVENR